MIEGFDVKDQALGTGDNNVYTFDFRIFAPTDLLIYVQDLSNNIIQTIRGDDTTFLASLVFDARKGGGTVTLANNLNDGFVMTFILAPDVPIQGTAFSNQRSFTLPAVESALDYLAVLIQRVAWFAQRSLKLHDLDDVTEFNPTLPYSIKNYPGGIISVKEDGTGFEIASTVGQIGAANSAGYYVRAGMSRGLPATVLAASGVVTSGVQREVVFVQSTGGTIAVAKNPQITPGTSIGQELIVIGCSAINILTLANGNGLDLGSTMSLGAGNALGLIWDGANWSEVFRR